MVRKTKKRVFTILLTLAMVMGIMPVLTLPAKADYTPPDILEVLCPDDFSDSCHNFRDYITNVTFAGINNSTDDTLTGGFWQVDFGRTDPQVAPGEVTIGKTYPISVTVAGDDCSYHYLAVYVDWNGDSKIAATGEEAVVWTGYNDAGSRTANITVPTDAVTGYVYMRVMLDADSEGGAGDYGCYISNGEFEDYVLNISAGGPSITTQPNNATVNAGGNTSFTVGATGATSYQWQVDTGSGFVDISNGGVYSNATTDTLNISGATADMNGYKYRVVVSGSAGDPVTSDEATLTVNSAPSDIALSATLVNENVAADTTVGMLSSVDTDMSHPFTYALVEGDGSVDNASFNIDGTSLRISSSPNYEAKTSYSVRVRTTDQGGLWYEEAFTITIGDLNDAPKVTNSTKTEFEDTTITFAAADFTGNYSDEEGSALSTVRIDTLPDVGHGKLQLSGADITAAQVVDAADLGNITFVPAENFSGSATFTWKASDGGDYSALAATMTLSVTGVNDAPSFTKGADKTVFEDCGAQSFAGWATALSAGPADESGQMLSFTVANNNNGLFSAQPAIASNGTLTFTPAANAHGTATVTVTAYDDGGIADGGVDASDPQTFTITVESRNDAPSFTKGSDKTVLEDWEAQSFAGWATSMSVGPADESGQTLSFTVDNNNNGLFSAQPAVASNGTLTFTPAANVSGTATVTVTAYDDGGTANDGVDASASQTFTITVMSVNDAPSFTKGADKTVPEDCGAQSFAGWATALSAGPADESGQTLSFTVANNNNGLFSAQPAVASNGTLTFTPAANASGTATVTVTAYDDGGTANDGVDASDLQTFTITVMSVNDAPSFTKGPDQTVLEDCEAQSFAGWATAMSVGPADESGQALSFTVANDDNGLFSAQPAVASNGTLTFTPAANASGTATVTVTAYDDGGTSNGGVDASASQTFTITVTSLNDAPSFTKGPDKTVLEDCGAQSFAGWATALSAGPADESGQTVIFTLSNDNNGLFSAQPAVASNGTLTFTPEANASGVAAVTVTAYDDGGTASGGVDASASQVFMITVTGVNDAPTVTNSTKTVIEDTTITFTAADFTGNYSDAESSALSAVRIETLPDAGHGKLQLGGVDITAEQVLNAADLESITFVPALNFSGSAAFTWKASDGVDYSALAATMTLNVTGVNDAPGDISLGSALVSESAAVGTTIGTLSTTDPDADDSFTYALVAGDGSDDNGSFSIVGDALKTNTTLNYATKNSYSIRVRTTDADGLTYEKAFAITVTETNHAPTDIALTSTSIDENLAADSTVGTLFATDANTWDTFTYTLVSGAGSTDNASFNIVGDALRLTGSANYEVKSGYSVRIRATDIGGLWYEEAYTITVGDLSEAPTDIALSASSVNENVAANTTVGTLSSTDADAGNTFTYTLAAGAGDTDNGTFNISGDRLRISISPDFDTKSSYSVRIRTTDQTNLWYEEAFTVTISGLNEAPTDIALSVNSVNENVAQNTTVGTLLSTDPDAGNTFNYSLVFGVGSTDNAAFNISGDSLRITNSPNFETKSSYLVRIRTTDQGSLSYEKAFTVTINDVNEAPTDMSLSAAAINENVDANTAVGTFSSTDPDTGNTFTYTLAAGTGDADNGSFNIDGSSLRITGSPNYEAKSSYTVRVRTADQGGLWYEEAYTITVGDSSEAPTDIALSASSVSENVTANTAVGTLSSTDDDAGSTFTYTLVAGAGDTDNGSFNIDGNRLRITDSPNYEAKNSYLVRVRSTDQDDLWFEKAITITISDLNEAPVITTAETISVVEGTTAAFTPTGSDPEASALTWSITGGADAAKFSINAGVVTFASAPSFGTPTDADANNQYILQITASDGALTSAKTVTVTVTRRPRDTSGGTSSTPTNVAVVEVNGESYDAGQISTQTSQGSTTTTITVDDAKLSDILERGGNNPTVTLPSSGTPDVVVGQLTGQTVKNMEQKEAVLEIKTESVTYTLPASQINIDAVSSQLGAQVELKDIKVNVKIAEPPADTVKIVEDTANRGGYQLVVKPVEFEITCTSANTTVEVSRFNGFVERTIAIPDGIDPSKITTGIVLNLDGTFSHVPTQIVVIDGKYYAKINSLTNSTYSVIYNPVTFSDMENHWAKGAVNDMGSRMVVTGIGNGIYEPGRSIARAEFAAIIVRALGLQKGLAESTFGDVRVTDWFNGYVDTATSYSLITGYDSASFAPNDTITREQAMTILARAMKLTGLSVSLTDSEVSALLAGYTDGDTVSSYAKAGVAACIKTGVVSGTTANTLSPKDSVTRAEVAVMVQRLLEKSGLI